MKTEITLDAIRSIIAEEIRRFAEEQAAAKAARPKARVELTAEEAEQYMTVDEVAAVTGYGVPSLRSMASKKFTPAAFPLLPVKVGLRSLYVRAEVMATPKVTQFAEQVNGFIATPKDPLPPTQIIDQPSATATGASIQNAINAAKPVAKKARTTPAKKATAPAAKQAAPAPKKAAVKAPAAKKAPAKKIAAKR